MSLRGVKCNICGTLGKHYSNACPEKAMVGLPIGMRQSTVTAADLEDDYLHPAQLEANIRKRPEVPSALRCRACAILAKDAIWCSCCDVIACAECLGPADSPWVCPLCEKESIDNFYVVSAVRSVIDAWFRSTAELLDPYCVSSDDEGKP